MIVAEIVSNWSKEFDIDAIINQEREQVLSALPKQTADVDMVAMVKREMKFDFVAKLCSKNADIFFFTNRIQVHREQPITNCSKKMTNYLMMKKTKKIMKVTPKSILKKKK